jgi:hypothetical protein
MFFVSDIYTAAPSTCYLKAETARIVDDFLTFSKHTPPVVEM